MSCQFDKLPQEVKSLFPKENFEFAKSLDEAEGKHLKDLLSKHTSFSHADSMMEECAGKCPTLHNKFKNMLMANSARLNGLSPTAAEFAKECICYVSEVEVALTNSKSPNVEKAKELHNKFKTLSSADQEALKKNNPDIQF